MNIQVNGKQRTLDNDCTIERLLDKLSLAGQPCAVEVNTAVIPRREHAERILSDGDSVEIVTLVGGG